MPRNNKDTEQTPTPTNGHKRLTPFQKEVQKQYDNAITAIKTLHRTSLTGEQTPCPTGDEETCPQCTTLRTYTAARVKAFGPIETEEPTTEETK